MSLIKKLASQTATYGISSILGRVFNYFILTFYLVRELGVEKFGTHGYLYTFVAFLVVFMTFRMETTYFRFASKEKTKGETFSTILSFVTLISIVIGSLVWVFADDIARILGHLDYLRYFKLLALVAIMDALVSIPFAKLRLDNKPIKFAVLKLSNVLINIFFVFYFIEWAQNFPHLMDKIGWHFDPSKKLDYVIWANLIASTSLFIVFLPHFKALNFKFNTERLQQILKYSFPLFLIGVAAIINDLIAIPLIDIFTDNKLDQGQYNGIMKLAILLNLFVQAFNYAAEPFFFNQSKEKNAKKTYADVAIAFTIVACIVFLAIGLFSDIAVLLLGKEYEEGIYILPILLLGNLFLGLYYNIGIWYKLDDKTWFGTFFALTGSTITIVLNILLLPILGILGAAIAKATCFITMVLLAYYYGQKNYPVPYNIKKIGTYIISSVIIYYGIVAFIDFLALQNTAKIATKALSFFIVIAIFWLIEKKYIKSLLKLN